MERVVLKVSLDMWLEMYVEMLKLVVRGKKALCLTNLYTLSFFQCLLAALAHISLKRETSKASRRIVRCIDLGNILHAAAPRRVTCYSSREIRIVWSSGVCKLPVVSKVFGNAVSGRCKYVVF